MASHDPSKYRFSTLGYITLYTTLLTAYYVYALCISPWPPRSDFARRWDTAMSQKSRFKLQTQGITSYRKTFPQLPWGTIKNPSYIQTAHG